MALVTFLWFLQCFFSTQMQWCLAVKNFQCSARHMAQQSREPTAISKVLNLFLNIYIRQLTAAWNSSSRKSGGLFWPLGTIYIRRQNALAHTKERNLKSLQSEERERSSHPIISTYQFYDPEQKLYSFYVWGTSVRIYMTEQPPKMTVRIK